MFNKFSNFFFKLFNPFIKFFKSPIFYIKWWIFFIFEYIFVLMQSKEVKERRFNVIKDRLGSYGLKFIFLILTTYIIFSILDFYLSENIFYEDYWVQTAYDFYYLFVYAAITYYIYYIISFYFVDLQWYVNKFWLIGMCVLYGIFLFQEQFFMDHVFKIACRWSPVLLALILIITYGIMPWVEWSPSIMDHPLWWQKTTWTEDTTSHFYMMNILQTTPQYVKWILEQYEKEFGRKYDGLPYRYWKKTFRPSYWFTIPWIRDDMPNWFLKWLKRSESWS